MRIGIDARFYGVLGKGLGRYTQKLIEALERFDTQNEYWVFLRKENFDSYQPTRENFHKVLADYPWYSFSEQWFFVRLLNQFRFDVVHFPHFNVPLFYFRPFVVTVHDLILLHHSTPRATTKHAVWYRCKFAVYRIVIWSALRRARAILTVSEYTKQDLVEHYSFLHKKTICVTYQAADEYCLWDQKIRLRQFLRARINFCSSRMTKVLDTRDIMEPYALYVGNAYPHKNLEMLVRVAKTLAGRGFQCVLVGRDDYFYRRLKQYAEKEGVSNILFVDEVTDRELVMLYRGARLYVFPSLYEGCGLPPLEAMSVGTCVVASSRTSIPEVLGEAALFFDPENLSDMAQTIWKAWSDETVREQLSVAGWKQVEKYSWQVLAQKTLKTYKLLMTNKNACG